MKNVAVQVKKALNESDLRKSDDEIIRMRPEEMNTAEFIEHELLWIQY